MFLACEIVITPVNPLNTLLVKTVTFSGDNLLPRIKALGHIHFSLPLLESESQKGISIEIY